MAAATCARQAKMKRNDRNKYMQKNNMFYHCRKKNLYLSDLREEKKVQRKMDKGNMVKLLG